MPEVDGGVAKVRKEVREHRGRGMGDRIRRMKVDDDIMSAEPQFQGVGSGTVEDDARLPRGWKWRRENTWRCGGDDGGSHLLHGRRHMGAQPGVGHKMKFLPALPTIVR